MLAKQTGSAGSFGKSNNNAQKTALGNPAQIGLKAKTAPCHKNANGKRDAIFSCLMLQLLSKRRYGENHASRSGNIKPFKGNLA